MGQADQSGAVALEDTYQDEGYDYGAYDDGTIDPNTGMPYATGADGNKDFDEAVELIKAKMWKNNVGGIWHCADCGYKSQLKANVYKHVESQHVPPQYYTC